MYKHLCSLFLLSEEEKLSLKINHVGSYKSSDRQTKNNINSEFCFAVKLPKNK